MSPLDGPVARALECVREWTQINGQFVLNADELVEFRSQLADSIRGVES